MENHNISGSEWAIRILAAFVLFAISHLERTSLIQAIAGTLVGGLILITALSIPRVTWSPWGRRTDI